MPAIRTINGTRKWLSVRTAFVVLAKPNGTSRDKYRSFYRQRRNNHYTDDVTSIIVFDWKTGKYRDTGFSLVARLFGDGLSIGPGIGGAEIYP
jgi:hypothetical protein